MLYISKQQILTRFKRYKALNEARLRHALAVMPQEARVALSIVPILLHYNHINLPGYRSTAVPHGIDLFTVDEEQELYLNNMMVPGAPMLIEPSKEDRAILGLYAMGSTSSLGQSDSSDLDIWVCTKAHLDLSQINALQDKCRFISSYMKAQGVELNLFVTPEDRFTNFQPDSLDEENCGSAQNLFLLDEFYRTSIRLCGRYIIWYIVTTKEEHANYEGYVNFLLKGETALNEEDRKLRQEAERKLQEAQLTFHTPLEKAQKIVELKYQLRQERSLAKDLETKTKTDEENQKQEHAQTLSQNQIYAQSETLEQAKAYETSSPCKIITKGKAKPSHMHITADTTLSSQGSSVHSQAHNQAKGHFVTKSINKAENNIQNKEASKPKVNPSTSVFDVQDRLSEEDKRLYTNCPLLLTPRPRSSFEQTRIEVQEEQAILNKQSIKLSAHNSVLSYESTSSHRGLRRNTHHVSNDLEDANYSAYEALAGIPQHIREQNLILEDKPLTVSSSIQNNQVITKANTKANTNNLHSPHFVHSAHCSQISQNAQNFPTSLSSQSSRESIIFDNSLASKDTKNLGGSIEDSETEATTAYSASSHATSHDLKENSFFHNKEFRHLDADEIQRKAELKLKACGTNPYDDLEDTSFEQVDVDLARFDALTRENALLIQEGEINPNILTTDKAEKANNSFTSLVYRGESFNTEGVYVPQHFAQVKKDSLKHAQDYVKTPSALHITSEHISSQDDLVYLNQLNQHNLQELNPSKKDHSSAQFVQLQDLAEQDSPSTSSTLLCNYALMQQDALQTKATKLQNHAVSPSASANVDDPFNLVKNNRQFEALHIETRAYNQDALKNKEALDLANNALVEHHSDLIESNSIEANIGNELPVKKSSRYAVTQVANIFAHGSSFNKVFNSLFTNSYKEQPHEDYECYEAPVASYKLKYFAIPFIYSEHSCLTSESSRSDISTEVNASIQTSFTETKSSKNLFSTSKELLVVEGHKEERASSVATTINDNNSRYEETKHGSSLHDETSHNATYHEQERKLFKDRNLALTEVSQTNDSKSEELDEFSLGDRPSSSFDKIAAAMGVTPMPFINGPHHLHHNINKSRQLAHMQVLTRGHSHQTELYKQRRLGLESNSYPHVRNKSVIETNTRYAYKPNHQQVTTASLELSPRKNYREHFLKSRKFSSAPVTLQEVAKRSNQDSSLREHHKLNVNDQLFMRGNTSSIGTTTLSRSDSIIHKEDFVQYENNFVQHNNTAQDFNNSAYFNEQDQASFYDNLYEPQAGLVTELVQEQNPLVQSNSLEDWNVNKGSNPNFGLVLDETESIALAIKDGFSEFDAPLQAEEWFDFGSVVKSSPAEYFGSGLWLLYKAIDSPFKVVLKILLMEAYSNDYPNTNLLSSELKDYMLSHDGYTLDLDAYYLMYLKVSNYLQRQEHESRLTLMRKCFYLKIFMGLNIKNLFNNNDYRVKRELLNKFSQRWGWSSNFVKELENVRLWRMATVRSFNEEVYSSLLESYQALLRFSVRHGIEYAITSDDAGILSRKLYAAFDRYPGKVTVMHTSFSHNLEERYLSFIQPCSNSLCRKGWHVYTSSIEDIALLNTKVSYIAPRLCEVVTWAYFNGILSSRTVCQVVAKEQVDSIALRSLPSKIKQLANDIDRVIMPKKGKVSEHSLQRTRELKAGLILINFEQDESEFIQSRVLDIDSNSTLCCGRQRLCLISSIDMIIINSWGEIRTISFPYGEDGVVELLASLLRIICNSTDTFEEAMALLNGVEICSYAQSYQDLIKYDLEAIIRQVFNCLSKANSSEFAFDIGRNSYIAKAAGERGVQITKRNVFGSSEFDISVLSSYGMRPEYSLQVPAVVDRYATSGIVQYFFAPLGPKEWDIYIINERNEVSTFKKFVGSRAALVNAINRFYTNQNQGRFHQITRFNLPQYFVLSKDLSSIHPFTIRHQEGTV